MAVEEHPESFVEVATREEIDQSGPLTVRPNGTTIALFEHDGEIFATDSRCPHMGFPLTEGTIDDGILTCHWHHARFELSCGDTLDPFADDLQAYPVRVEDGRVYVDPSPKRARNTPEHWIGRLEHGLQENISLVLAKACIALDDLDVPYTEPVTRTTGFGVEYNAGGWGRGLTTLGVMANLYPQLQAGDRPRALYVGIREVAQTSAGEAPFFAQDPLSVDSVSETRLDRWFRDNIDVRDADGAERVLRAAIRDERPPSTLVGMLVGAATDHLYLDTGHRLDFINKAVEVLDHIGWEHADTVLPSLVPGLASASRAEESSSWRQPIDLAALLFETDESLPPAAESARDGDWEPTNLDQEVLLGDDPHAIIEGVLAEVQAGAPAPALAETVAEAAASRVARFGTSNEFRDWNTVHHTYTYANAVCGLADRTDSWVIYRAIFEAAVNVYLDRFLNMPPTPVPEGTATERAPEELLTALRECFEVERDEEVNRAGQLVADYLAAGGAIDRLIEELGAALVREDVGFHTRQNVEAAAAQARRVDAREDARIHLIAATRYLAAHTPTRRSGEQTYRIADRLHRGERIHETGD